LMDFHEIWYLNTLRKSVEKIPFLLQSNKNKEYFNWRPIYINVHISYLAHFVLEWKKFQTKDTEKLKLHILCSVLQIKSVAPLLEASAYFREARKLASLNW
jgi:hypothetical protein